MVKSSFWGGGYKDEPFSDEIACDGALEYFSVFIALNKTCYIGECCALVRFERKINSSSCLGGGVRKIGIRENHVYQIPAHLGWLQI